MVQDLYLHPWSIQEMSEGRRARDASGAERDRERERREGEEVDKGGKED